MKKGKGSGGKAAVDDNGNGAAPKYNKYELVEVRFRLLTLALGCAPNTDPEARRQLFERDGDKKVLRSKHPRAVTRRAIQLANLSLAKAAIHNCFFEDAVIEKEIVGEIPLPSPGPYAGARGTGVTIYETLEAGTEITVRAHIPTSVLSKKQFVEAWRLAGRAIGFSPAKAHLGYGRFEVIE